MRRLIVRLSAGLTLLSAGAKTVVKFQRVLSQRYFDVAAFPGRTLGLDAESGKQKTAGK
jgi:hypothetical protein